LPCSEAASDFEKALYSPFHPLLVSVGSSRIVAALIVCASITDILEAAENRASSTAVCLRFGDEQNALLIDGDQKMLLCLSGASTLAVLPDGLKALRTAGP
jgi:hypothetical protein